MLYEVITLGYLSAIFVITAILSALTLLPAVLGLLGKRYDALRLPWLHRRSSVAIDHDQSGWARWAKGIARHPCRITSYNVCYTKLLR